MAANTTKIDSVFPEAGDMMIAGVLELIKAMTQNKTTHKA